MAIGVYLDNCIWDFLFERQFDLSLELPRDEFCVCIPREVEFEILPLKSRKLEKYAFIQATIEKCGVQTDAFFGLAESYPPDEQRFAGFNMGRWASSTELAFIATQRDRLGAVKKGTKLPNNEADIALAARSFHSAVLLLN